MCREGVRRDRHDGIANGKILDGVSDRDDPAGAFHADRRTGKPVFERLHGKKTDRPHHVAVVQGRGSDLDPNLVRQQRPRLGRFPGQGGNTGNRRLTHRRSGEVARRQVGPRSRSGDHSHFAEPSGVIVP